MTRLIVAFVLITFASCSKKFVRNTEAIDDPTAYELSAAGQLQFDKVLTADAETTPVRSEKIGADRADDPAIWYNEKDPSKSVIFGTNKWEGIHSYDLDGNELQHLPYGKVNNVDVRQGVLLGEETVDILAGSNRLNKSIDLFVIDTDGSINEKPDYSISVGDYEPYGFCLYKDAMNNLHTFFNDKYGYVLQHRVELKKDGTVSSSKIRKLKLKTQAEGMVVDDQNQLLYISEEQTGIHVLDLSKANDVQMELLKGSTKENDLIRFDWEGLALLPPHYLIASSQGNFSYAIFDLNSRTYVKSFTIRDGMNIDGAEETDGLEVLSIALGEKYPKGILVVQDGFNRNRGQLENQNFKIVDLRQVLGVLAD